jgi:hypothetical protein
MKTTRGAATPALIDSPAVAAAPEQGWWRRFWFTPIDPVGLHAFRVLAGLLFLAWLLPFAGHTDSLFGLTGWFDRQAYTDTSRMVEDGPQQLGWSFLFVCGQSSTALQILYWTSIAVLAGFTLGLAPRLTGLLSWAVVVSFSANPALEYDGDVFLTLLAFYLMLGFLTGPSSQPGQSWLSWLLAPGWPLSRLVSSRGQAGRPSLGANLALRLFQVHFAIVMVATGLHKLQFGDWWGGVALWYPLVPPMTTTAAEARQLASSGDSILFVLSAAAYAVLVWQIGFPLFAWRRGCRVLLLGGAVAGWLGTALVYRLPVMGPALLVGCLAYLSAEEWRLWQGRLVRCWQAVLTAAFRRNAGQPRSTGRPAALEVGQPG